MNELADETQKNYRQAAVRMLHHFGHFMVEEVEPTHGAQFLEWCKENTSAITGNRDKAFMSSVWEHAMRKGWARYNPWRGVRRNRENPSRRYVEHSELSRDMDRAPPCLVPLYGIGYLLGNRQTDLRLATWDQVFEDPQKKKAFLKVTESKTGKENEHEITAAVRHFLNLAAAHRESVATHYETRSKNPSPEKAAAVRAQPFIFLSAAGLPWSKWGLQSALRRFRPGFRFRDLRPKAQTDQPDKDILGHTGQMRERYHKKRRLSAVK